MSRRLSAGGFAALIGLAVLVSGGAKVGVAEPMRHVSKCRLCQKCHLSPMPPPGYEPATANDDGEAGALTAKRRLANTDSDSTAGEGMAVPKATPTRRKTGPAYDAELDPTVPIQFKPSSYQPRRQRDAQKLPVCDQCYGCEHNLTHIASATNFLNNTYINEKGATSSWIFKANTNMTPSGEAVVKLYCLPIAKRPGAKIPSCKPSRIAEIMRQLMAIDKLSVECGFTDLVPRMWLAPVKGIVPDVGYPIDWYGLWMEYVDGISLENLLHKGAPKRLPLPVIADLLNNKLNASKVVRGAVFDLLTSQCDRHAQNIFMQEDGNIKLIDNEACLQHMWRNCGFDSILVPTTQKQEIVRLANHFVLKLPVKPGTELVLPKGSADPQLLLDYRCYLPGGSETMGNSYDKDIAQCLKKITDMTPKQVRAYFDFPDVRVATNLHTRAIDMLTHGFEWAAKYGAPQNAVPKRYRLQPKCCKLAVKGWQTKCGHTWEPVWELPKGNPITGREWDKDRPDTGSYEGGTFPEDGELGRNGTARGWSGA
ncbi:hypothetical protein CHLRE_13g588350v5 [Chlamydomonas reinhardtii]|uniref:PI3K/PI4K catalytic domain-containing protein n=1 Tax=Chlamydomonas reinhardtii TaxID=3055 RepID=A0A2K3D0W9_CHLRE|nr:uncharacterized protein CHLRE_13g588350v5 [Chlamydomonas reinhardtii]PNW74176.1 hypothetical protein CHLRE_13g588350v5 [Chlamydomonas reinhardtii]